MDLRSIKCRAWHWLHTSQQPDIEMLLSSPDPPAGSPVFSLYLLFSAQFHAGGWGGRRDLICTQWRVGAAGWVVILFGQEHTYYCITLRGSCQAEPSYLRLLPWAVPWHHLHHQDQTENSLLFLQSDRALPAHRCHGRARLHAAPGLRREAGTVYGAQWPQSSHFSLYSFFQAWTCCWP